MQRLACGLALTLVGAAVLSACGSGGGSASTSGVVTGSYFRHAKVCLDRNGNGRCDAAEPSAYTDDNGAFRLSGQGDVVVEVGTDAVRYDPDTQTAAPVTEPLVFRAPAAANGVVSSLSSEVADLMDGGMDLSSARSAVAARVGVPADKLLGDHNKESDPDVKAALKAAINQNIDAIAGAVKEAGAGGDVKSSLHRRMALSDIKNVVVIYAENRGFDNLYGLFPGANGIPGVNPSSRGGYVAQKDFDNSTLPALPPTWGGLTAAGQAVTLSQAQTMGFANKPFQIDDPNGLNGTGVAVPQSVVTRDLVHRFYNNQMQINGGANDKFAAYSDAGGLTMGYYDGSKMAMWKLAQQYTLADNFFMGAFGGSFLNHQYLVCACAPQYPNADASPAKGSISAIDTDGKGNFVRLTPAANTPASVLSGAAKYLNDNNLTPKDAAGMYYAVNTMQPAFQPSGNAPASGDASGLYADPAKANTLPAQTQATIADRLDAKQISWAWYAGGWAQATSDRSKIYNGGVPNFQAHHQPFNYYASFDSSKQAAYRGQHLKDFDQDFLSAAAAGALPQVAFYKPQGNLNQHAGYASVADGDAHIASVIAKLQQSPQWKNMLVVVTYDENGGFYDHAAVPKGDRWGPGTRIPAILISPFAKKGYVDHTQYDTASILRFLTRRFGLQPLPGVAERDVALVKNGGKPMGDFTSALTFN
ncbi:acid phosphatase [Chromobacterium piscinae]|uniref:acid phosphatase n=1 Tax=Chromobacterium piscinae TaxID=686831 RepID=UPI001C8C6F59|nr:acid phosphatase [Chromobacterium piscinae]MBX9297520.1 acid phosphatase [Chromobacterium vaccinii]MBX9349591.1 acid phosphatase [Chromobacterium vaccinii]MBX9357742.1 acid phosphatase [Chromobacterium vaccinii]MCD4503191.1 acid phosphatase [Chromobacterium piscinae]MCD5327272.1 acid phosphatase [Chromobacterium piscinae]